MDVMAPRQIWRPAAQRAQGRLALGFKRHGEVTRIEQFFQEGCLKARLPRPAAPAICEAVTLNISGGIAGGDDLTSGIALGAGAAASITTQSAERVYRALRAPARIRTQITLAAAARCEFLPQETILYDGFALDRALDIELAETATLLAVEALVFGRQAMGERLTSGVLRDRISLRRGGRLVLQDMTRLQGDIDQQLRRRALGNGAKAMASLLLAGPGAPDKLPALRAALAGTQAGASAFEGIIFARILAPDGASLRNCLLAALKSCRGEAALPRSWQG